MQRQVQKAAQFKFVDLSSDGDSDYDSEKEKADIRSRTTNKTYTNNAPNRPITHTHTREQTLTHQHSSIINHAKSTTPLKDLQFSTLSLEDESVQQFGHPSKYPNAEKVLLQRENQQLKVVNRELQRQLQGMIDCTTRLQQKTCDYQERLQSYEQEIDALRNQLNSSKISLEKTVREYENKLVNYQLPGSKNWMNEVSKVYDEVREKIKALSVKHLQDLAKERMSPRVEELITLFVNQLSDLGPGNHNHLNHHTERGHLDYSSDKFRSKTTAVKSYRSTRMNETAGYESHTSSGISEDYRLLGKSIEKLKNMEKAIEGSSGSYLKKKTAEDEGGTGNKSVTLDQNSIGDLNRSKSRRKRIFQ